MHLIELLLSIARLSWISPFISLLSEFLAGHISGSPPAPLTAKQRTGIPPVDFLIRNQKSLKLGAYGQSRAPPWPQLGMGILSRGIDTRC